MPFGTLGTDFSGLTGGGRQGDPSGIGSPEARYLQRLQIIDSMNKKVQAAPDTSFAENVKAYKEMLSTDRATDSSLDRRRLYMRNIFGNAWESNPDAVAIMEETLNPRAKQQLAVEKAPLLGEAKLAENKALYSQKNEAALADAYVRAGITAEEAKDPNIVKDKLSKIAYKTYTPEGAEINNEPMTQAQIDAKNRYDSVVAASQQMGVDDTTSRILKFTNHPDQATLAEDTYAKGFGDMPMKATSQLKISAPELVQSTKAILEKDKNITVPEAIVKAMKEASSEGTLIVTDHAGAESVANRIEDMLKVDAEKQAKTVGTQYAKKLQDQFLEFDSRASILLAQNASGNSILPSSIQSGMTLADINKVVFESVVRDYGPNVSKAVTFAIGNPTEATRISPQFAQDIAARQKVANDLLQRAEASDASLGNTPRARSYAAAATAATAYTMPSGAKPVISKDAEKDEFVVSVPTIQRPDEVQVNHAANAQIFKKASSAFEALFNSKMVETPNGAKLVDSEKFSSMNYGPVNWMPTPDVSSMEEVHSYYTSVTPPLRWVPNDRVAENSKIVQFLNLPEANYKVASKMGALGKTVDLETSGDIPLDKTMKGSPTLKTVTTTVSEDAYLKAVPRPISMIIEKDPDLMTLWNEANKKGDGKLRESIYYTAMHRAPQWVSQLTKASVQDMYTKDLIGWKQRAGLDTRKVYHFSDISQEMVQQFSESLSRFRSSHSGLPFVTSEDAENMMALSAELRDNVQKIDKQIEIFEKAVGAGTMDDVRNSSTYQDMKSAIATMAPSVRKYRELYDERLKQQASS
jgi:hypothetical protein